MKIQSLKSINPLQKKKKRKLVQSFWIAPLWLNQPIADHYGTPAECRMGGVLLGVKHEQNRQKSRPVSSGETDVKFIKDEVTRIKAGKCGEKNHTINGHKGLGQNRCLHKGFPHLTPFMPKVPLSRHLPLLQPLWRRIYHIDVLHLSASFQTPLASISLHNTQFTKIAVLSQASLQHLPPSGLWAGRGHRKDR